MVLRVIVPALTNPQSFDADLALTKEEKKGVCDLCVCMFSCTLIVCQFCCLSPSSSNASPIGRSQGILHYFFSFRNETPHLFRAEELAHTHDFLKVKQPMAMDYLGNVSALTQEEREKEMGDVFDLETAGECIEKCHEPLCAVAEYLIHFKAQFVTYIESSDKSATLTLSLTHIHTHTFSLLSPSLFLLLLQRDTNFLITHLTVFFFLSFPSQSTRILHSLPSSNPFPRFHPSPQVLFRQKQAIIRSHPALLLLPLLLPLWRGLSLLRRWVYFEFSNIY